MSEQRYLPSPEQIRCEAARLRKQHLEAKRREPADRKIRYPQPFGRIAEYVTPVRQTTDR